MAGNHRRKHGFTLIEMMIVVAIIGLLAAIAIPSFQNYQFNAKRGEAYNNLAALVKSQKAYFHEHGAYIGVPLAEPGNTQGTLPQQNKRSVAELEAAFASVGWTPDGDVFYDYDAAGMGVANGVGNDSPSCSDPGTLTLTAYGDVDGDGSAALIVYYQPDELGNTCGTGLFNHPPPVDAGGDPILNQVTVYPPTPGVSDDF